MWLTFAPKRIWCEALWCNGRSAERKNVIEQRAAKTGIIVATETMSRYFRQKNIYLARRFPSSRTFHLRRPRLILALSWAQPSRIALKSAGLLPPSLLASPRRRKLAWLA